MDVQSERIKGWNHQAYFWQYSRQPILELIPDKKRDEMPRKWRADGTNLKVREADEHLHTDGRKALLPKVVWPDVQPSLQSRLMDHLVLLTGGRKWWRLLRWFKSVLGGWR